MGKQNILENHSLILHIHPNLLWAVHNQSFYISVILSVCENLTSASADSESDMMKH
jgi:hypothetical protein